ncbi:MAG: InlB B-repeat-containing protein [Paludibacteraceae bacterium]|nr:InlB B-repeat-containing protein [Paludibacteraceae bacterium]
MKNIFSKTTENRTQNGVKSYLSPTFVLYTISIFTFLTLGVGQMWADITYSGGHIYFDNSLGIDDNTLQICARQVKSDGGTYTGVSSLSNISNTKLYYVANPQGSNWGNIAGWVVISANPAKSNSNFDNWSDYTWCSGWNTYGFNSGSTYLIVPSSKDKNQSVTTTYCDGGYGAIPKYNATQGAKWRDTGTSYSITTGTYPATLKLQGTYLSGNGKSARSTITSTASTDEDAKKVYGAVVTGEITHSFESLNSSYYFEGWGTGDTPSSTDATHTYNISENTTTYAFFSKTYTLTYDRKGTFGTSTLSVDVSNFNGTKESGSAIPTGHQITFTATPEFGYIIEGWYSDAECTVSLSNGQNPTYTISSLDADRSVYVKFEQLKTITIKFAHEAKDGWTIQGVRRYPESGGQSISANGTWVTIEFTNVYAVSNIDLAYQGGDWDYLNTATKITGDCCYNKDGSLNASCCVPPANPTWGTAPANGAIGGSMTATINNVPDGATVEWSSSATSYATVDNSGHITYVAAGNATITAHVTWSATGDYCAGSYDLTKEISCTSGATVSVERTCAAYVAAGVAEQVSAHITFTGTSSGWKYRIKQGWSTGYETGWLDASGTSADWTMTGGMDAGERTYTVELYTTEGAATPVSTANFSVTGETAYNTTIAAGANGSVSPSGTVYANNNHVHPTITATPNEHYHFVNWTSNNAAASVASSTSATTTVTATAGGYTITANFAGDKYTITYKDQGGVDYSGNNIGSLPATHTYGTATDLVNGTKEGFTFGGWYTDEACTGEAVTSIGATAKTSNFTLYAKWTEKMSTLSTSNSYSVGDPSFADPTKSVSSIGISTTATVTAHANELGYTLTGWTITGGTRTDGGAENANPITVRSNGDGAAVSVTANYVGSNTPVNIFLPNTGNNWNVSDEKWKFDKLPGEDGNTVTLAVDINKSDYSSSNYKLGFNIYQADWGDKWWHYKGNDDSYMDAHNCTDWGFNTKDGNYKTNLDLNVSGRYTFTLKNSNSSGSQKLSVTYPDKSFIEGDFPTAWSEDAYTLTENGDIQSVRINITTKGDKQFRLVSHGKLFGTSTKITAAANSKTLSAKKMTDEGAKMTLDAYVTGEYTFTYNKSSQNLTITFPAAYRVTYGVGTGYTSPGRVSTSPNITSGDYVIAGTNITFTATPNLGYKFVGWYSDDACTGDAISPNASYTIASLSANTTLYAKFDYRPLYIQADWLDWGTAAMTQSDENRAVYTYEIDNVAARETSASSPYNNGYHFRFMNANNGDNNYLAYNYDGVHTPKGSGFLTDNDIHKTDGGNPTIQYNLTRKSDITITLTLREAAKPTVHIAADPYYTVHTATGGSGAAGVTISPESVEARSGANSAEITATIAPGYTFVNWTPAGSIIINSPNATTTTVRATGEGTLTANATANSYTVHFDGNGNTGGDMSDMPARTYGVAFKLTANAFTKTGYTFAGWATEADGKVRYADEAEVSNLTTENNGTATLYAKWTPKNYTVTLDKQTSAEGYGGNEGTVANQTVTFDATLTTVSGSMPTAKNGWAFMGFYSATGGNGRRFIDPSGNWVTTAGDTIRDSKWVHAGDVTLYAYYKKAQITNLIFDAAVVAPGTEVGVTPFVDPTPEGTNSICWKLLYNNGNLYTPKPEFRPANPGGVDNKVTFTAPPTSGMYLVAAVLRTGTDCNGGTKLDSVTYPFQVAGDHTVTVQYKCGDVTLQGSTSVSARPLDWSEDITAPTITGYTFTRWEAGDGITIKDSETNTNPTHIKAIYDGKLTAIYTKKRMIYFNNTLGWSAVYVYFYENNKYWGYGNDADKGTGSNPNWRSQDQSSCPFKHKGAMTQIEGTNIWYYDCEANSVNASYTNVAFNENDQTNYDYFINTKVVRRGDYHSSLPMFVPLAGVDPVEMNNKQAKYYNEGYWMNYPENTGYTLHIYSGTTKEVQDEIRSIAFPFTADKTMPMEVTLELNANTTYGYEIHRADNTYHANDGTIKINASSDIKLSKDQRGGIKTSAAGDYVFKLNFGNSNGYGYLFSVQYPASEGSYRLVYKDLAEWSQGSAHTDAWSHPSRVIYKNEGAADTVSFFVAKGHTPTIQIQKITSIDNEGNITWENVGSATSYDTVSAAGVYNFITSQTASALSIDKVEPYTGNYYIRTDNAGTTKWDNYRAADHQMTYSEFSKDRATNTFGELYTHYYMHWCPRGTNVKFCIANDYSSCITDTLVNDVVSLGNMDDPGWLNSDGANPDYRDKFSANIRFMYDERTNKISRAYMSSSTNTDRKFLVLKSNTEFWNSDGSALNGSGESAVEGNYEAIFKDNEDWIYEREIKLNPGQKFKLYASYAQETAQEDGSQHFCGNYAGDDWENAENYVALVGGSGAPCNVRIIYDFKTNRLLAAMVPSGEISTEMDIYADVMFIREHQGDIEQLIFNGNGKITNIKTAYGVMRFNKWTLNNREKTGDHIPLASPASIYERAMYFISFPFEVKLSEVFGFGTYGQDWIIEYYDGAERARTGWWEGQPGFWRYVWDRKNFVLKPNVGYLLELELGNFKEGSGFWNNKNERLELFFPSSGNLGSITSTTVNCSIPEHACTIDRAATEGLPDTPYNPRTSYNRTIFDSHWNVMSVPTYVNATPNEWSNTTWTTKIGPKFLYTWNMEDNTLTATSGVGYRYHAMHAYMVQYGGNVQWVTSGTKPAAIVARNTYAEEPKEVEFRLEIQQNEKMVDQTFVIMSNDDQINANFQFGEDMSKDFNARNANIYTMTADNVAAAGNSLPMSENTTIVPVGVSVKKTGDYTFSIPDGTNGVGITLIDEETGIRTSLSALDYTVNLAAGDYTERFWLEISPIQNTPTGIEEPTSDSSLKGRAQKRIIDGVLYIVKDGKIFDARGTRVE